MKMRASAFMLFCLLGGGGMATSTTISWTNTAGGDWNNPNNWSPNQAPINGDNVTITNSGNYSITNASTVTLDNLILGGTDGAQILTINSLTLTSIGLINSNGVLNWAGGDLEGSMTVAPGGRLTLSNTVFFAFSNYAYAYTNTAVLTNYGTVVWAGTVYGAGNSSANAGGGIIYNAGLWQAVADNQVASYNSVGTNFFINAGTLEKIGGPGTSTINWTFLNNSATVNTSIGSFSMGNWMGNGELRGSATFSSGTISGTLATGAVMNFSATINGSLTVSATAVANWNGGDLEGSLTVAPGGTLSISNSVYFTFNNYSYAYTNTAALTNHGTVIWAGAINAAGNSSANAGGGIIYNAGLWQAAADNPMGSYNNAGTNFFINTGTLEKIGGTGASPISWNFASTGTIDTVKGAFTLNWSGPSTLHGNLTLAGGAIASALTVAPTAVLNLSGGDLEGSLTVASGGTVTLSNTVLFAFNNYAYAYTNTAVLTNYGTVIWAGTVYGAGNSTANAGGGIIYNAGLWQAVTDDQMRSYNNAGTNFFINVGTLEKTGGTASSTIAWNFINNGGIIDTPVGYFTLSGNWSGNNVVRGNAAIAGNIGGIIASNAVMIWLGGDLESSLTVAPGGTLTLSNTVLFAFNNYAYASTNTAMLTNYGTVVWAGTIYGAGNSTANAGGGIIYNAGLWQVVADNQMASYNNAGTNYFINVGTLEKTAGSGTSTLSWNLLNDHGVLGSQTNTLSLTGNYDLTGGTLNVGLNSLANNGVIHLSGSPVELTGGFSANLNNGYVPATGSSFSVVTYSSETGTFTNFDLPFPVAWQTNYGGTAFTLTVLNVRPVFEPQADRMVDELTPLVAANGATDADAGQTLTYSLLNPPAGAGISASGTITWTPTEAQGPGTNLIMTVVTDDGTPSLSATNSFTVIVNEVNVAPVLPAQSDRIINELTTLIVTNAAIDSDIPVNPLGYALLAGPSGASISASGVISWTPTEAQGPSTNTFTTVVTDTNIFAVNPQNLRATNTFTVVVNEINLAPVLTVPSNQTINELVLYTNNATATDSDIPTNPLAFALVSGPNGLTVSPGGAISWTPTEAQGPSTNVVQVKVTDFNQFAVNATSLSTTSSFTLVVTEVNSAPVLGTLTNRTVNPGQVISFVVPATDSDLPTNILTFSLVSPPAAASLNSASGLFNWRPATWQANTTNVIQIRVTDNGTPNLSDTNSFTVVVNPVAPVLLSPTGYTNGQFQFQVSGSTGPDYIIMISEDLTHWSDLTTNFSPVTPFHYADTNAPLLTNRVYRVRLSP